MSLIKNILCECTTNITITYFNEGIRFLYNAPYRLTRLRHCNKQSFLCVEIACYYVKHN